jgi:hypothetical protein
MTRSRSASGSPVWLAKVPLTSPLFAPLVASAGACCGDDRKLGRSSQRGQLQDCSATDTMHYMSAPLSIRFDPKILERLRRRARAVPGATPSGLAERLVDEGLRMAEHPGIVFKDGPSGRRAALSLGPDVWEVVKASSEVDERGEAAVLAVADILNLAEEQVRSALRYYADHQEEVDAEIALADEESAQAEEVWMVQQQLLA